jgi:periplasmic protein CpxP/Spy
MNLNKYLIAVMLAAGMAGTITAQDNSGNSYKNQEEYLVLEEGAASTADYQTRQMIAALGLNSEQAERVKAINLNRATEIERAKAECGDDLAGFNKYVDKVAVARDQELKSVLTPEQFSFYTNNKSDKTWLGMDKFKFRPEGLTVKENKHELKIKGKASIASEDISASNKQNANEGEFSDAYNNNKNIIETPEAVSPDYHNIPKYDAAPVENVNPGAPEIKTYPGEIKMEEIYGIKPEYDNMYSPNAGVDYGNKCGKTASKKVIKQSGVKASAKSAVKKSSSKNNVAKSSAKTGSDLSSKKTMTISKSSAAAAKKKSTKHVATAKNKKPNDVVKEPVPEKCYSNTFSSEQTLKPAPNSDDFFDTTASAKGTQPSDYGSNVDKYNNNASAKPDVENYFINEDSKAKFSEDEIKIKPEEAVKYKITDKEIKLKDGREKLKENDKELKMKDGHKEKIKSNGHETKIKDDDLKVKIKE